MPVPGKIQLATREAAAAVPARITVRTTSGEDDAAWDRFVLDHAHGSPFHLSAWRKTIEAAFAYRPVYLAAFESNRVRAVLPLFLVRNILVRSALISTPFAVYGGILADTPEARDAIVARLVEMARSLGVQYVELRNGYPEQRAGFTPVPRYVTFTQEVGPDEEAVLDSIPRKTRRMVRKALAEDFSVRRQTTAFETFETLYAKSLRRLGTPCFPRRHFELLIQNFGNGVDIREIVLRGEVVAAVMTFCFRDQVLPYYGASDPAFNAYAPNNFMYYDLMRWAGANGYRVFDFGRSKKNVGGSYDFKAHWGMVERELPYEMLLIKRKELPNFSPANPRFRLPIKIWQHLPLAVTRVVGPRILRLVP